MATYAGGTQVRNGYYVDAGSLTFVNVEKDGGALPGGPEKRWRRVPVVLLLAAAPVIGGLFVVILPVVGFGAGAYAIGRRLTGRAKAGAKELAATVASPWVPGEAHLTGRRGQGERAGGEEPSDDLVDLEQEIAKRRRER